MDDKKKLFDISIRNNVYSVYNIPSKINSIDGGTDWVKFNNQLFNIDEYIPCIMNTSKYNKINWEISIRLGNSLNRFNVDKQYVEGYTSVILKLENREIYSFICNNIDQGFNKMRNIIYKLEQLPINFYDMNKLNHRKIFYKGIPFIIVGYLSDGKLVIKLDCSKNDWDKYWDSLIQPWFTDVDIENHNECKHSNKIKVDIIDDNIHWYRDERRIKILKIKRLIK